VGDCHCDPELYEVRSKDQSIDRVVKERGQTCFGPFCAYLDFVASGIGERLHDGRIRSYPGGHRRYLVSNQSYPGAKNILAIWPRAGEGEVFGKEVVGRSRKILQNLTIASVEKVS